MRIGTASEKQHYWSVLSASLKPQTRDFIKKKYPLPKNNPFFLWVGSAHLITSEENARVPVYESKRYSNRDSKYTMDRLLARGSTHVAIPSNGERECAKVISPPSRIVLGPVALTPPYAPDRSKSTCPQRSLNATKNVPWMAYASHTSICASSIRKSLSQSTQCTLI